MALGDDDPLFFGNTITGEYNDVQKANGLDAAGMLDFTKDAVNMPNVPAAMKVELRKKIQAYETQIGLFGTPPRN